MKLMILISLMLMLFSCDKPISGRYNYELIKKKINITSDQESKFNDIAIEYTELSKKTWYEHEKKGTEVAMEHVNKVYATQDSLISLVLNADQYEIYAREIRIEREGRDRYSVRLIKKELNLSEEQSKQFDLINKTFYKTLYDAHDNYHGQPDVYREYYNEINKSRLNALKGSLDETQFALYTTLAKEHKLGESED